MSQEIKQLTAEQARKFGYRPITFGFESHEEQMLKNAIRDLKGCNIAVIRNGHTKEIWRDGREIKETPET